MKNYFDFQLNGRKFFPLWIIFYVVFLIPYFLLLLKIQAFRNLEPGEKPSYSLLLLFIPLLLTAMIWSLYFLKLILENIAFKETNIQFSFNIWKFIGLICLGMFLSLITLGIYSPWFVRDLQRFTAENSSWRGSNFSFRGTGGQLFLIIMLTLMIPIVLSAVIMIQHWGLRPVARQLIMMIAMIPYMYFVYKWAVKFNYKEYQIGWNTKFWPSAGKILLEMVLSIITFGIYLPLAYLRLYEYFSERTGSTVGNQGIKFGYDLEGWNDFTLVWGQTLLTLITLGIYYPWAFAKVGQRVLGKTYMERIES